MTTARADGTHDTAPFTPPPLSAQSLPPEQADAMRETWGSARVEALADIVLALSAEVFELRVRISRLVEGSRHQQDSEQIEAMADAFAARIFAPLLQTDAGDSA